MVFNYSGSGQISYDWYYCVLLSSKVRIPFDKKEDRVSWVMLEFRSCGCIPEFSHFPFVRKKKIFFNSAWMDVYITGAEESLRFSKFQFWTFPLKKKKSNNSRKFNCICSLIEQFAPIRFIRWNVMKKLIFFRLDNHPPAFSKTPPFILFNFILKKHHFIRWEEQLHNYWRWVVIIRNIHCFKMYTNNPATHVEKLNAHPLLPY